MSATGDIAEVLAEIRAISAELVEIKRDVRIALTHGTDIDELKQDVLRIGTHLERIDEFMAGPPALTERLAALERKQEKDRKAGVRAMTDAGFLQEGINVGFRSKFSELFSSVGALQMASLRLYGILLVLGVAVVSALLKVLGF